MSTRNRGWWKPPFANANHKWHYYAENGRSLCGKYAMLGGSFDENSDDPKFDTADDNCVACQRKLAKVREPADDSP